MSPVKYVLPRCQRTHMPVDRETHIAVKEYARTHDMTMAAALSLIIAWGLKWLVAIEEEEEKDHMKTVLKFYQLYKERQKQGGYQKEPPVEYNPLKKEPEVENDLTKVD